MKKFLIVGNGGRESVFAKCLMRDAAVYAIMSHENPTIIECVENTGGAYLIGNPNNPKEVLDFAKICTIDYVFVNSDQPLANGVVDVLLENNIKAIGGTKKATQIEWDKIYSISLMQKICPEYTPFYKVISNEEELKNGLEEFKSKSIEVVIKPQGLTGGKGVKVMPIHLKNYQECYEYGKELLDQKSDEKVLLVEKLKGIEFTIMGLTDGKNISLMPATYDYPYRLENDEGPGTGGMGCFTVGDKKLPFLTDEDWRSCEIIMQRVIDEMGASGIKFNGVLNGGFFKTENGIQFMEFNSRFGDPESLNVLTVLKTSFSELLISLYEGKLSNTEITYVNKASVVKYLVAKEYPFASPDVITFEIDTKAIEDEGLGVIFASCVKDSNNKYNTLKSSRVLALIALGENTDEASIKINKAIEKYFKGKLEYRKDIGSRESLEKLKV